MLAVLVFQEISLGSSSGYRELPPLNLGTSDMIEENIVIQPGDRGPQDITPNVTDGQINITETPVEIINSEVNLLETNFTPAIPVENASLDNFQENSNSNLDSNSINRDWAEIIEQSNREIIENNMANENNIGETNVWETNVLETNVPETNVLETNLTETNVWETNVLETNVSNPIITGDGPPVTTDSFPTQNNTIIQNAGNIPQWAPQLPISDRNVEIGQLEARDGVSYVIGENTPYTGTLTSRFGATREYVESYSNGRLHGDKIWYSDEDRPIAVDVYNNGRLDGTSFEYYLSGATKTVKVYVDNRISSMRSYDKSGNIIHDSVFTDGSGHWKLFWETERPLEEGNLKNGVRDGEWRRYQSNGTVDNIRLYSDGSLIGESWN